MGTIKKVSVNGQVYDLGGSSAVEPIEITYDDLVALKDSGGLTQGSKYRIIDYVTDFKSADSYIQSGLHQFDIIVTASSNNSLYEDATVELHKDDVYFDAAQLKGWKVKYSLSSSKFKKGEIKYMRDEKDNEADFDFKNIMFKAEAAEFTHLDSDTFLYLFSSVDSYTGEKNVKDHSLTDRVKRNSFKNSSDYISSFCVKKSLIGIYGEIIDNIVEHGSFVRIFENNIALQNNIRNNKFIGSFYTFNPVFAIEDNIIQNDAFISFSGNSSVKNSVFISKLGKNRSDIISISKTIDSCLIIGDFIEGTEITNAEDINNKIITAKSGTVKIVDIFDIL